MKVIERKQDVIVKDKWSARRDWERIKNYFNLYYFVVAFLTIMIPPVGLGLFGATIFFELLQFYQEYFSDKRKKEAYDRVLAPQMAYKTFINIGYEIAPDEINRHLEMVRALDSKRPEAIKYLKVMDRKSRTNERFRQIGVSKSQLTTHFWVIGTTGAGKTSFIMQLMDETLKLGGGMIFVDGKADISMFYKAYNLASKYGRENDVYLINFLPTSENREHTNTFNPVADMSGKELVEFMTSLHGEVSGDKSYWLGRGKALLSPIANMLYFRKKFYGENYTLSVINDYLSDLEKFMFLNTLAYAMMTSLERKLKERVPSNLFLKAKASKGVVSQEFPYIDALSYYYEIYPSERMDLAVSGFSYDFISELNAVLSEMSSYTKQLSSQLWDIVINNYQNVYDGLSDDEVLSTSIENHLSLYSSKAKKVNAGDLQTELQQHAYAQQQWTEIFSTLLTYSNIFSSLEPEVDIKDILINQKILYVLLPPLKQSDKTTMLLGRLIITAIRKAVSYALGEEVEGLTARERAIYKRKITPVPLGLLVLDEYGAYPVEGIDTILAQVRSINISVILSTQDYTSARTQGQGAENAVKRAWANTQKLVLRVKDNETIKALEELLKEKDILVPSYISDLESGYTLRKTDVQKEKERVIDPKLLTGFKNGMGMIITDDTPIILQIYWADSDEADKTILNHSSKFN